VRARDPRGTRPLLVEVQALVDSGGPSPRRLSVGIERDRLAMMLAVLHRHAGISAADQDVFVNAVGGVRISEPAADLAVMLAIQSSLRARPLPRGFSPLARSAWRVRSARRRAARSGFAKPPSSASASRWCRRRTHRAAPPRRSRA
jgi:predicted ATP-dependent serine protease